MFQVAHNSLAFEGGLRSKDYLIKINGQNVFNLTHNECTELVKRSGESLRIEAERFVRSVKTFSDLYGSRRTLLSTCFEIVKKYRNLQCL